MTVPAIVALGSPLDCSGRGRGEQAGPDALRATGLLDRLGAEDVGDVHPPISSARREPVTGIIAESEIRAACAAVRDAVLAIFHRPALPLVLGGDCAYLPGCLAAARRRYGRAGLAFVDGHLDFFDGATSSTGEAADMDLAEICGYGDPALTELAGEAPMVNPADVVVLGHRIDRTSGISEADLVDDRVEQHLAGEVSADPARAGAAVADRLAGTGAMWLHIDLDVLDPAVMPAITYPQPGGLTWEALEAVLEPLAASPALIGVSIADLVPPLDPDGAAATRTAGILERVITRPRAGR
jgi:arginase